MPGAPRSLRGRNSRLPQDRRSGLARASAARRARRAAHRTCAVQFALIRVLGTSFSLNMTRPSEQERRCTRRRSRSAPRGEGHGWPEFHSPQMRHRGRGKSEFSLSRLSTAQTPRADSACGAPTIRRCYRRAARTVPAASLRHSSVGCSPSGLVHPINQKSHLVLLGLRENPVT